MLELKLRNALASALTGLYQAEISPEEITLEKTRRDFTGDYTFVVFPFLKISRKSPESTANEIGQFLLDQVPEITSFQVIKGFLNLTLQDSVWSDYLLDCLSDKPAFPSPQNDNGIVLEYSSPNTNKPLHLGHVRNNLLGHAISEILREKGLKVIKVNLVNDRGIHICKSMLAYMRWGNNETPSSSGLKGDHLIGKYYVLFDTEYKKEIEELVGRGVEREEAEKNAQLIVDAREILQKWESGEPETISLWKKMNGWVYEGFEQTYKRLGIQFDKTYHESDTYLPGKSIVDEGLSKGVFFRKDDGSVWVNLTDVGLDQKLLLRADGTSVYITQDLGTAELRFNEFHPDGMIYVVGNEQNYHFDVLKKVLGKLGRNYADSIYHLSYGMVELPFGKMKSREGTVVDADDLMEEMFQTAEKTTTELGKAGELNEKESVELFEMVGLGALKYFILKVDPRKNMLFDPAESIDFNGHTGPFIQYTHARIQSLLKRGINNGYDPGDETSGFQLSLHPLEKEIIKQLFSYRETIQKAADEYNPAVVANYVYELAKAFNSMYQELPVLKEENTAKLRLRLAIAKATGKSIAKSMKLLGISCPDKM